VIEQHCHACLAMSLMNCFHCDSSLSCLVRSVFIRRFLSASLSNSCLQHSDILCLVKRSHNEFGDCCFATAGPTLWNSLCEHTGATTAEKLRGTKLWVLLTPGRLPAKGWAGCWVREGVAPSAVRVRGYHLRKIFENSNSMLNPAFW